MRRLFYDIETSPNLALVWRAGYKVNVSPESIIKERAIITIAWKWQGEKKILASTWDEGQDDRDMLLEFLDVMNQADEAVAHFGDSFDWPWIKGRCLFHGITDIPKVKTVDTVSMARKNFYFNSNKLDYLAKYLGLGGKIQTGYDLWKDIVLNNCPDSLAKMVRYNKQDVKLLEQVWERMSLVAPVSSHVGVMSGGETWTCPRDGSDKVAKSKTRVSALGYIQHQMKCGQCGSYYTISNAAHNLYTKYLNKNSA